MSESERIINDALHLLAGAVPQGAPERIELVLRAHFRRERRLRRMRRAMAAVLATGAVAASVAAFVLTPEAAGPPPLIAAAPGLPELAAPPVNLPERKVTRVRATRARNQAAPAPAGDFVMLPYGDASLVDESAVVVRVDLPRSALRLAGFIVAPDRANERVQADVVLGPDGLAHAVRLVSQLE